MFGDQRFAGPLAPLEPLNAAMVMDECGTGFVTRSVLEALTAALQESADAGVSAEDLQAAMDAVAEPRIVING